MKFREVVNTEEVNLGMNHHHFGMPESRYGVWLHLTSTVIEEEYLSSACKSRVIWV